MGGSVDIGEIFAAATIAVGKTIGICAVGFLMARYPSDAPLMNEATRKGVGKILLKVMVPALAASSLAMTITPDGFADLYPMWGWCTISLIIGFTVANVMARLLGLKGAYKRGFIAAGTFGNNVGLPLIILAALCKQPVLEAFGPYEDCKEEAYGMIMFYGLPWRIAMFGLIVPWIGAGEDEPEAEEEEESSDKNLNNSNGDNASVHVEGVGEISLMNRNHSKTGMAINGSDDELLKPMADHPIPVTDQELDFLHTAQASEDQAIAAALGRAPPVPVEEGPTSGRRTSIGPIPMFNLMHQTKDTGAGDCVVVDEYAALPVNSPTHGGPKPGDEGRSTKQILIDLFTDINILAPVFGVVVGLLPDVQKFLFGPKDGTPTLPIFAGLLELLGEPVVAFATLGMASALLPRGGRPITSFFTWKILREVIGLCSVRFVIVPGLGFVMAVLGHDHLGIPGNRLSWLIVLIQFCLPSPQVLIVSMVALGKTRLAQRMAPVYVVTYLLNILTLTGWAAAALIITNNYDEVDLVGNATLAPPTPAP